MIVHSGAHWYSQQKGSTAHTQSWMSSSPQPVPVWPSQQSPVPGTAQMAASHSSGQLLLLQP